MLVGRYLELPSNRLRPETRQALDRYEGIRADELERGWLVHVSEMFDARQQVELGVWPEELLAILELARKRDCGRILFDSDARGPQPVSARIGGWVRLRLELPWRASKGRFSEVRVGNYLDLSPSHLRGQTNRMLGFHVGISVDETADGWLMRTPSLEDARERVEAGALPHELLAIVELAWQRRCGIVLFDRDTWLCKELPYFEEVDGSE